MQFFATPPAELISRGEISDSCVRLLKWRRAMCTSPKKREAIETFRAGIGQTPIFSRLGVSGDGWLRDQLYTLYCF